LSVRVHVDDILRARGRRTAARFLKRHPEIVKNKVRKEEAEESFFRQNRIFIRISDILSELGSQIEPT
jgi:chromosome segregation ATPase